MKVEKDQIINEIIRTTQENNGKPLGQNKFESETGIKKYDWHGKYWSKWGDALVEAGYQANKFNEAYDENFLLEKLVNLIREMGKFPSSGEIKLKAYNDEFFPHASVFERRFGKQKEKVAKIIEYCKTREGMNDILEICLPLLQDEREQFNKEVFQNIINCGFVYLMKSGKYHKIGRSNDADRRAYELRIILPEKLEVIHKIKTDDPIGIEEYWHKRFKDKRKNGEWFELSKQDIEFFKRRRFM